jgi:hypothetical protein
MVAILLNTVFQVKAREDVSGIRCFGDQMFRGSELDNCRVCVVVEGVCVVVEGVCVLRSACFSLLASLY